MIQGHPYGRNKAVQLVLQLIGQQPQPSFALKDFIYHSGILLVIPNSFGCRIICQHVLHKESQCFFYLVALGHTPSGFAKLCTKDFKPLKYRSYRYIHCVWTSLHWKSSSIKCIIR